MGCLDVGVAAITMLLLTQTGAVYVSSCKAHHSKAPIETQECKRENAYVTV
ncbi:hypothetical protein Kisp01_72580 [Kineosporia sp. NBRC 101677]|nr:hypothetical protein Kisp01_72580 [Kineosporia sp. NBRC 101677]